MCNLWPNHIIRTIYDLLPLSQEHPPIFRIRIMRIIQRKNAFTKLWTPENNPHFCFTSAHKNNFKRQWACGLKGDLWPHLGNYSHFFGIAFTNSEVCGYYAGNCSIEKVVYPGPVPIFRPNNEDIIRIIEIVNGVYDKFIIGDNSGCEHN